MLESKIENDVKDYAKKLGCLSYKFVSPSNRAVPDQLFIFEGRVFFIEFKAPGKKPTKLQSKIHKTMQSHGAEVYVIDDLQKGKDLIDEICTA